MATANADRNLLFGILALQMDFISREALITAMNAWVLTKSKPLGQLLTEQGALAADRHALLEALVQEHLRIHGNDVEKSLAAVTSAGSVRDELRQIADPDLEASLTHVSVARPAEDDPYATRPASVGAATSSGTRFRILRPHRKGGLGEVFVAHDDELHREVALKHIQECHADNLESRTRFVLEAEITGGLEHPGIVPVYGLGQYGDGRPFYAMRFIRGDSLHDAIKRFHRPAGAARDPGAKALELRQLLGRFLDVCHAIAYAHSRGILHRDLKPGNVMLGQYGETLVVDWGLAKALAQTASATTSVDVPLKPTSASHSAPTQAGQAMGTPQYMSPEQAAGRHDRLGTASDVYSLGATLYCLLTGQAPFKDPDLVVVLENVQKGDFPPPRQVNPRTPPALEAICLKAMATQPEERYPSPLALADDVEHWLADEPVSAYRERLAARLVRWARRHKPLVAGLAGLFVTGVIALGVGTVLIWREEARTEEQRRQAEANFQTALRAVNEMLTEVAQEQLAYEPGMEKKRRTLLARARTYYAQFLEQKSSDPGLRRETALAYKRLGDISRLLGEHERAKDAYDQAIGLLGQLATENPSEPEHRHNLAASYTYLGEVLRVTSRPDEAQAAYDRARDLEQALVADFPGKPEYKKELARVHYNLGILFKDTKQPLKAEKAFGEAIRLLQELVTAFGDNPDYRQHLARGYLNLGPVLRAAGRPEKAREVYQEAIRLQTDLMTRHPLVPDYRHELGVTYINLGYLLESLHRTADAEAAYRQARELFDKLVFYFPSVPVYRKELANTLNNLAIVRAHAKNWPAAEALWRQALRQFTDLAAENADVPDYQGSVGMALGNLGWLLLQEKQPAQACRQLRDAIRHVRIALNANARNPMFLTALRDQLEYLADALVQLGEHAEAARTAEALPAIFQDNPRDCYLAAAFLARCATLAENDARLAKDERRAVATRYADRTLALLEEAVARGYKDVDSLDKEPFAALRRRDDFNKRLAELAAKMRLGAR
ncbi:MAG TPA: protein kinase [Gemmataceae bacterium]|jgi:serine/threonine-protein kinase|nr:protein kinase [Gemmataceae bacterium]